MAEVLVIGKKISEMGLVNEITGEEKIPTSALGDKAVTTSQLLTYLNNNGVAQWGRIGGDINNQVDLQNQFAQERNTLKSYTQEQVSQQQVALQEHIDTTNEVFEYTRENGSALPYREGISYDEGAVVVKDGMLQQLKGGSWKSVVATSLSDTIQTFNTPASGVDQVTGVADGAYFNVRSSSGEPHIVEYRNVGGSAVATGKRYLSSLGVQLQEKPANTIKDESGKTQQEINNSQQEINDDVVSLFASVVDLSNYGSPNDVPSDEFGLKAIVSGVPEINVKTLGINSSKTAAQNKVALNAAIAANSKVIFRLDEIIKLDPIVIPANKTVSFYGLGGFTVDKQIDILFTAPDTSTLYFNNLNIEGADLLQRFFSTSGSIWFRGNKVKRLRSITASAAAGVVSYGSVTNKIALLEHNDITDISGIYTGATGDSAGATRAFTIQSPTLPTNKTLVVVRHNNFDNIFGREGDIIQCYDHLSDSDAKLSISEVLIFGNTFGGSNRRAIKVQGNNVKIRYNIFNTIDKSHPEWNRDGQGGAGVVAIGTFTNQFNNKGCDVIGNTFNNNGGIKGSIYIQSHSDVQVVSNKHIDANLVGTSFLNVFMGTCKRIAVIGNEIHGSGHGDLGYGEGLIYSKNIHNIKGMSRSIFDNMLGVPSKFIFEDNVFNIEPTTPLIFLGVFLIAGANSSPFNLKGALIRRNTISDAGSAAHGSLFRLPNRPEGFEITNARLESNYVDSTFLIYASGNPFTTENIDFFNNRTSGGQYPVVLIKGTTAQRPSSNLKIGQRYYDTTLLPSGKPIEWDGVQWVDMTGVAV